MKAKDGPNLFWINGGGERRHCQDPPQSLRTKAKKGEGSTETTNKDCGGKRAREKKAGVATSRKQSGEKSRLNSGEKGRSERWEQGGGGDGSKSNNQGWGVGKLIFKKCFRERL